ncbi:hypothetical protein [Mesorhizobium sp. ORM16]|uniref:hypothetical protein n=1 Tax=Mesorhizobium sp. ORM16 TaxID=3376989 RepID=UPI003857AF71
MTLAPGVIRDSIVEFLATAVDDASITEITSGVRTTLGEVPASSVRSYLNINTPDMFERTERGRYRLKANGHCRRGEPIASAKIGKAVIFQSDCFEWLANRPERSIHAFVTDPPYGVVEYTEKEKEKLRTGKGESGAYRHRSTATSAPHYPGSRSSARATAKVFTPSSSASAF